MASKLAQNVLRQGQKEAPRLFGGKARQFYWEVCRCLPFIYTTMRLEEIVSLRDLRAIVKEKFKRYQDVKDPRVVDMLLLKGREELEITEYLDPVMSKKQHLKPPTGHSAFLDGFFEGNYKIPTGQSS
eukprot:jgi/Chrzof1/14516/Cz09g05210.t1